ncbi:MAG: hypothetical protein KDC48_03585 [Planctomycetes bacterium]|nr:hypothetical protein [Planctomycetota bacterium]
MKRLRNVLPLVAVLATACGPAAIGAGIGELSRNNGDQTVVLLFVNDGGEPLQLRLEGLDLSGAPLSLVPDPIPALGRAELQLPRALALRVRAAQLAADLATPPVTWDFRLEEPNSGASYGLGVQAAVVSGLTASGSAGDQVVFDRLVGGASNASFERVCAATLPGSPQRFALHPGGGYVYSVRDTAGGAEITALRVDARSAAFDVIGAEFGRTPTNPRTIAYDGAFADLDVFVEPLGRVLYVVQRQPAAKRSVLAIAPILADGTLGEPQTAVRGLIGDLAVRADGRRLYLTEDLGDGAGYRLADFALTAAGQIDFLAASAAMPCVVTEGGQLALHPTGRVLYLALRDPVSALAKVGAYFVGDNGGVLSLGDDCSGFESVDDLVVDPTGRELYLTGTALGGARRVLRYALDPVSGALGAFDEQDLGAVSRLTSTADPSRASGDPLHDVVFVAVGDRLVPHLRQAGGALAPLTGAPALDYGSPSNTHFVTGAQRGTVGAPRSR